MQIGAVFVTIEENMTAETILKVENLSVSFEAGPVVQGVDFELGRGENLVILGPNGAGKSILLRAILGLVPYRGRVSWGPSIRAAYIPQNFFPDQSVPLTVREFFNLKGCRFSRAAALLQEVGLEAGELFPRRLGILSGGQFQRVMVAWSLVGEPQALLFDEPTSGVDTRGEETIYALLGRMSRERGLSSIFVTHDFSVVYSLATKVLCLNREAVCFGPPLAALTPEILEKLYGQGAAVYAHRHE